MRRSTDLAKANSTTVVTPKEIFVVNELLVTSAKLKMMISIIVSMKAGSFRFLN